MYVKGYDSAVFFCFFNEDKAEQDEDEWDTVDGDDDDDEVGIGSVEREDDTYYGFIWYCCIVVATKKYY